MAMQFRFANRNPFPIFLPDERGGQVMFREGEHTTRSWFSRFVGHRQLTREKVDVQAIPAQKVAKPATVGSQPSVPQANPPAQARPAAVPGPLKKSAAFQDDETRDYVLKSGIYFCLTGDTLVSLVDGTERRIDELVAEGKFCVYAVDSDLRIQPAQAIAFQSGVRTQLVKIVLDNGKVIQCTPEHRFMLRDGTYREAADLRSGDSLMPLYRKIADEDLPGYELLFQPNDNRWHYTHRQFVYRPEELKPKGLLVHHKNFNKRDNCPENLEWMSSVDHAQLHSEGTSRVQLESWKDPDRRRNASAQRKAWHAQHKDEFLVMSNSSERKAARSSAAKGLYSPEVSARLADGLRKKYQDPEYREHVKALNQKPELRAIRSANAKLQEQSAETRAKRSSNMKLRLQNPEFRAKWGRKPGCLLQQEVAVMNHKVASIELLLVSETPVYDLTVEKFHNFALTAGVFVHNCKHCDMFRTGSSMAMRLHLTDYHNLDDSTVKQPTPSELRPHSGPKLGDGEKDGEKIVSSSTQSAASRVQPEESHTLSTKPQLPVQPGAKVEQTEKNPPEPSGASPEAGPVPPSTPPPAPDPAVEGGVTCDVPGCNKTFRSARGLTMHKMKAHSA